MEGGGWKREAGRGMAVAHASWLRLGGYIGNLTPSAIAPGPRISQGSFRGPFPESHTIPGPTKFLCRPRRDSRLSSRGPRTCFDGDARAIDDGPDSQCTGTDTVLAVAKSSVER